MALELSSKEVCHVNVTLNGAVLLTGGLGTEVIREEAQLRGGQCGGQAISQHRRFCLVHIMGTCQADFWYIKRTKPSETGKELTKIVSSMQNWAKRGNIN